jgi:hypothetical protein
LEKKERAVIEANSFVRNVCKALYVMFSGIQSSKTTIQLATGCLLGLRKLDDGVCRDVPVFALNIMRLMKRYYEAHEIPPGFDAPMDDVFNIQT